MNVFRIDGNTVAYDKVISSNIKLLNGTAFSPVNTRMRMAKTLVNQSDCDKDEYRTLISRALDAANEIDYTEKSARDVLSEIVIEAFPGDAVSVRGNEMKDSIENQIIKAFCDKPDIIQILSAETGDTKDIWLVVEDALSDSALQYNDTYYEILKDNDYFEFKVLDSYDIENLGHIQTTCLFRKDVCNAR